MRASWVSGLPHCDVVVVVECGAGEEVGQRVVDSRTMNRLDGEVVVKSESVQLTKQGSELFAARSLPIDDVHIGAVVNVEEQ
jgi:hypothetical protein